MIKVNRKEQIEFWEREQSSRKEADHRIIDAIVGPKIDLIKRYVPLNGKLALDVGSGNGYFAYHLSRHCHVIASDISQALLKRNPAAIKIKCDACRLPFKDSSFDVIVAANLLHHVEDPAGVIGELRRLSRDYVIICDANRNNIFLFIYSFLKRRERGALKISKYYFKKALLKNNMHIMFCGTMGFITPNLTSIKLLWLFKKIEWFLVGIFGGIYSIVIAKKIPQFPKEEQTPRIIVLIPAFNEENKIPRVVMKIFPGSVSEILVINDGSTDATGQNALKAGANVICHEKRKGIGAAIRTGINYALKNKYDIIVVLAGNDKDDPGQIGRLTTAITDGGYDYVQGSRYVKGGVRGKMPIHRLIFTKGYSLLVRLTTGGIITDATNGFRAYRSSIFNDKRIDISQDWLDQSLEYYLSIKVLKLRYKVTEVPVSKIYPQNVSYKVYTKIKPFSGWIERLKPLFYLTFGLKK